ncbi:c-type cytochrome [Cocleimonas flava]|uniref:Cytochrome c n=1 Tax=Cocleimonas flava TaxID=634765 RepID=A0A4R1EVZ6_9GAMM|nr:c-type cytochrome [Cocleimonas flava]TCJ84930.1 cytochrome c [Cocleimonas flava]
MKRFFITFVLPMCLLFHSNLNADAAENNRNLVGHGGPVNTVAISPDGKSALSGSLDYAVMLWDLDASLNASPDASKVAKKTKPNSQHHRFIAHKGAVSAIQFFPSGDKAISSGDHGNVYVWDLKEKKVIAQLEGHLAKVVSIDISNDAKVATTSSWDGHVILWDLATHKLIHKIHVQNHPVNAVLISEDAKTLYSAGYDGKIRSWDATTGDFIKVLHSHGWPINIMRWLPEQKQLIFGTTNGDVQIFDPTAEKIVKVLIPHEKPVLGLAVSKQHNLIASGGNDGIIRVWDITNWELKGQTITILGPVWALAFNHDGKSLYYGSLDDEVKYWKITDKDDENLWIDHKPRRFQVKTGLPLGELQFARKCSVCHTLNENDANRAGPTLHNVFGRKAGSLAGYNYSDSLKDSPIIWDEKTIDELFVEGPAKVVPGTKMPLQKVADDKQRKALIAFLKKATQ